jgi:hypothetical protein
MKIKDDPIGQAISDFLEYGKAPDIHSTDQLHRR